MEGPNNEKKKFCFIDKAWGNPIQTLLDNLETDEYINLVTVTVTRNDPHWLSLTPMFWAGEGCCMIILAFSHWLKGNVNLLYLGERKHDLANIAEDLVSQPGILTISAINFV